MPFTEGLLVGLHCIYDKKKEILTIDFFNTEMTLDCRFMRYIRPDAVRLTPLAQEGKQYHKKTRRDLCSNHLY